MSIMERLKPVTFCTKKENNLQQILHAIDTDNILASQTDKDCCQSTAIQLLQHKLIETNNLLSRLTDKDCCLKTDVMIPPDQLLASYAEYPQIIVNTQYIIDNCHFEYDFKTPKNKKHYTANARTDIELLTGLAYAGM